MFYGAEVTRLGTVSNGFEVLGQLLHALCVKMISIEPQRQQKRILLIAMADHVCQNDF